MVCVASIINVICLHWWQYSSICVVFSLFSILFSMISFCAVRYAVSMICICVVICIFVVNITSRIIFAQCVVILMLILMTMYIKPSVSLMMVIGSIR